MVENKQITGSWQCTYWFPSNSQPGAEEASQYTGTVLKTGKGGKQLVFESQPNASGSYLIVRMSIDADLATGTWHESTSPTGEFEGSQYSGAFQALVDESGDMIEGKWAGVGQEKGQRQIYTGRIQLSRLS